MREGRFDPSAPPAAPVPPPAPADDTMRRLQIGLAGVLTVLLLVGMAGLIGDRVREDAAKVAAEDTAIKMPGDESKSGSTPLEELGVQPVSKDAKAASNPAADITVPQTRPTATVPDLEPDPALERARQSKK